MSDKERSKSMCDLLKWAKTSEAVGITMTKAVNQATHPPSEHDDTEGTRHEV